MQKRVIGLAIMLFLTLAAASLADNIYQYDSLQVKLDISGKFTLTPTAGMYSIKEASAELMLYPQDDYRQKTSEFTSQNGQVTNDKIRYKWDDNAIGEKEFGYSALIQTKNERIKVPFKVPFPLRDISGFETYTLPSLTIDSENPKIIDKASELAEGEDDAFKVAFKLANWVEENVHYDLNTLTAQASQKASWVLDNKEGVCDEMSSLFIAMARSLGMPARFVSGISYTNSELFTERWQPHGWAEAYFPEIGWVSFDIAFGEYGYVDVTHLKLRDSIDPAEPAVKYEWKTYNVNLTAKNLQLKARIVRNGTEIPEDIQLEQEILAPEVNFGSYNLVKSILKNKANYYAATTLQLAVPPQISISGRNKRTLLMAPGEVKETYWTLRVPVLNENYSYKFPTIIYSEKNVSVREEFSVERGKAFYSENEIKQLTVVPEAKTYSRRALLTCELPRELHLHEMKEINCTIKNSGDTQLNEVNFCLGRVCEIINLSPTQQYTEKIKLKSDKVGWSKLMVSADNLLIDKRKAFDYLVLDDPQIKTLVQAPELIAFGKDFALNITLNKTSLSNPRQVRVKLNYLGTEQLFELEELRDSETINAELRTDRISRNNHYLINVSWQDSDKKPYSTAQEITLPGIGNTFSEKIKMLFNGLLSVFQ